MPTYAYACTSCGHEFEAVQSISDAALTACPECSGALRKVFHPVGVTFKGSGFYRTDSRAGGGSTSATSTTAAKPAGEGTSGGSSGGGSSGGGSSGGGSSGGGSSGKGAAPSTSTTTPTGGGSSGSSSSTGSSTG